MTDAKKAYLPFPAWIPLMTRIVPTPSNMPASSSTKCIVDFEGGSTNTLTTLPSTLSSTSKQPKSRIFPSTRFFVALLLMLCYLALAVSTSNISVSMVCMIKKESDRPENIVKDLIRIRRSTNSSTVEDYLDQELGIIANSTGNETGTLTKCELARLRKRAIELEKNPELIDVIENESDESMKIEVNKCQSGAALLEWTGAQQGIVFAAQNAGSLTMLLTGAFADRLNSKWCIVLSLSLLIISNALIPAVAQLSVWLVIILRVFTGFSDALLQPSTNSMITRWFPPKERPFAIGLITGGRQLGSLIILPTAGFLCGQKSFLGGWPSIFYVSAFIVALILVLWILLSADKPAKHFCISQKEQSFVQEKIREENVGKRNERKSVPWKAIVTCKPLYAGVAALICHEWPLVIMLQLLPKYMSDVLNLSNTMNGIVSAVPIVVLFISKTLSSSLASLINSRKRGPCLISRTNLVKIFNGIASLGLGVCTGLVPCMNSEGNSALAIVLLCLANGFAGMHTPGVQTALLQLAPAYSGIVTGIAFGFVAIFSIINKVISNAIVKNGSLKEWTLVFEISAVVAVLPVVFFSIWGSADRQSWATQKTTEKEASKDISSIEKPQFIVGPPKDDDYSIANGLRFTMFLNDVESLNGVEIDSETASGSFDSAETDSTDIVDENGKF